MEKLVLENSMAGRDRQQHVGSERKLPSPVHTCSRTCTLYEINFGSGANTAQVYRLRSKSVSIDPVLIIIWYKELGLSFLAHNVSKSY